ncbi:MAG TPA: phytanoyl-CoA dioxygenase family protein [Planctomycetota bacterium]|nr:phytanoyl-CoA dioxygenase family protein [Planctomycetota bacterium]
MLGDDQMLHFSERGWMLLPRVFAADECAAMRAALERQARFRTLDKESDAVRTVLENPLFHDQCFLEWFHGPGILDANRRALGAKLRFQGMNAHITPPHPQRDRGRVLLAPDGLGWHRGMRPKWGTHRDDDDARFINATFLNNITCLRDVAEGDGATAMLEGSHLHEGDYASLKGRCPVVFPAAPEGSVILFTESLIHAAAPILSGRTRHALFTGFVPPWWACWPGMDVPRELVASIRDELIRDLLAAPHFGGQVAEWARPDATAQAPATG